jgi:hypothetical protein
MKVIVDSAYHFLARYWNATLAALSLMGIVSAQIIPVMQQYSKFFIFLGLNALVWTVIEIKAELRPKDPVASSAFPNMRIARAEIVKRIEEALDGTSREEPLEIIFVGGRLRSMSDLARELADDLRSGRCSGHAKINIYCVQPEYIRTRLLPGAMGNSDQQARNEGYSRTVASITDEMSAIGFQVGSRASLKVTVQHYAEDPHFYAYLIGRSSLFWGPYTYSESASDFMGPENPCFYVSSDSTDYPTLWSWLTSRMRLYDAEALKLSTGAKASNLVALPQAAARTDESAGPGSGSST